MKVIIASPFEPRRVGHGGHHRAYQIWQDVEQAVGKENIIPFRGQPHWWVPLADDDPGSGTQSNRSLLSRARYLLKREIRRQWRRATAYRENPLKFWGNRQFQTNSCLTLHSLKRYHALVESLHEPAVCLIEHSGFGELVPINKRYGIRSISCTQNLESLDTLQLQPDSQRQFHGVGLDLANELRFLAQCDARLFISRVETGLLSGLGFGSYYYPYLPVGDLRDHLTQIRVERGRTPQTPGLFLIVGTAGHHTTADSVRWFLEQAQAHQLPRGVRVVVVGAYTDNLLPKGSTVSGLELRGWVEQSELDDLLLHAQGVLIPQRLGFGALTRLPEMACAGIPTIVSQHAALALDLPPGIQVVADSWVQWCEAMIQIMEPQPNNGSLIYDDWECLQSRPLAKILQ